MRYVCLPCLLLAATFSLLACGTSRLPAERAHLAAEEATPEPAETIEPAAKRDAGVERWGSKVLAATKDYTSYTKVSDYALWAPTMCAAPVKPTVAFMSDASGKQAHGEKLYFLWVKYIDSYNVPAAVETPQQVGQIIVKETYFAVEGHGGIKANGKEYETGDRGPLFVMMHFDGKTSGTDNGWIYATMTGDGKEVTSAGKLESCMGCHDETGDDRVFGVKPVMNKDD